MKILGINDGHNASAILLENGKIISAIQEERITREKNKGGLPKNAIGSLDVKNTNLVALATKGGTLFGRDTFLRLFENELKLSYNLAGKIKLTKYNWRRRLHFIIPIYRKLRTRKFDRIHKNRIEPVEKYLIENKVRAPLATIDHHRAHAAAAYYGCGNLKEKILVLTNDGAGDRLCATVSIGENGKLKRIAEVGEDNSIARIYAEITFLMGMVPLEHEYKVMGLAPYGEGSFLAQKITDFFDSFFCWDKNNPLIWKRRKNIPPVWFLWPQIIKIMERKRFDHLAAGLQHFIEKFLVEWVKRSIRETGIKKVALGGGIFMNVKANQKILELPEVEELFIMPSCGDETNALGAAYWTYAQERLQKNKRIDIPPLGPLYFGNDITEKEIESTLKNFHFASPIKVKYSDNIEKMVAKLLATGEIVARAKGRMEFGARALGNRSILANPTDLKVTRTINKMIKKRDFWMPFAPSVLAERTEDYYIKPKPMPAPYMVITFNTQPKKRNKFIAACHLHDSTTRPQEVYKDWNPDYWRLLKYYEELTGEGIILNTSFNLHGYPIVSTAWDALDVFNRSGLKYLALGNYLISKSGL